MVNEYNEVCFSEYCLRCKHQDCDHWKDPCNECLSNPVNLHSSKPVNFEEKENKK
jgi:hypothetical protein